MDGIQSIDRLQQYLFVLWLVIDESHVFFLLLDDGLQFSRILQALLAYFPIWTPQDAIFFVGVFPRYIIPFLSISTPQPRLRVAPFQFFVAG